MIKKIWNNILSKKYLLAILVFLVWIFFIDNDNVFELIKQSKELKELETEKEYYIQKIKEDSTSLNELRTNRSNLEKFAREKYLMKKKDEEIIIIEEE